MSKVGYRKMSSETINEIAKDYKKGKLTLPEISKKYGISTSSISRYMKELGIGKKTRYIKKRKVQNDLTVNANYFDTFNIENVRDFAFVFRYGSVCTNRKKKELSLFVSTSKTDKLFDVVHRFSNRSKDNLYISPKEPLYCRLRVQSLELCDKLKELGVKEKFPWFEDEELNWNFYDAYFEEGATIKSGSIRMSMSYCEKDNMVKYLSSIGIEDEELYVRNGGIELLDEKHIEKVLRRHPRLRERMIEYCNNNSWSLKWSRMAIRFRNDV